MRGDLVTIAMQGDFGKPRPALVVQANQFSEHGSVTVLPVTSTLRWSRSFGQSPGRNKLRPVPGIWF